MSIPVAGSTAGTGFTYRQYVRHGRRARWPLGRCGVWRGLDGGARYVDRCRRDRRRQHLAAAAGVVTLVAALPVVAILLAMGVPTARRRLEHLAVWTLTRVTRFTGRPRLNPRETVADTARQLSAYRVHWRHGVAAISYAALNWLLDALCLWTVLQAFGVSLPFRSLSLVYAAVVASAAVGLTPAGIGTVETAIVLALRWRASAAGPRTRSRRPSSTGRSARGSCCRSAGSCSPSIAASYIATRKREDRRAAAYTFAPPTRA